MTRYCEDLREFPNVRKASGRSSNGFCAVSAAAKFIGIAVTGQLREIGVYDFLRKGSGVVFGRLHATGFVIFPRYSATSAASI